MQFDVLSGEIVGAHDVSGNLCLIAGKEIEESVLLDVEVSLDGRGDASGEGSALLKHSVDLEEASKLDDGPGGRNALNDLLSHHMGVGGEDARSVDWVLDWVVAVARVAVRPIWVVELGGGQSRGEKAEEDEPRNGALRARTIFRLAILGQFPVNN